MNLKIREAVTNDYLDIKNLVLEVHNLHVENRPDIYSEVDNPLLKEQFENLLNSNDTKLFVVENTDNEELLAFSVVQIMTQRNIQLLIPSKVTFIDNFCVKSTYKKKGIGKSLFKYIIDYAKLEGTSYILLTVSEFNENAIRFYESVGMSTRNRKMELFL